MLAKINVQHSKLFASQIHQGVRKSGHAKVQEKLTSNRMQKVKKVAREDRALSSSDGGSSTSRRVLPPCASSKLLVRIYLCKSCKLNVQETETGILIRCLY